MILHIKCTLFQHSVFSHSLPVNYYGYRGSRKCYFKNYLYMCMCTNEVFSCLLSKFLKSQINRNTNQCVMYLSKALMSWKHDNLFSRCPKKGWIIPVEMTHLCLTSPWSCACCMHKEKDCLCCLKERTQSASVDVSVQPVPSLYFRHGG